MMDSANSLRGFAAKCRVLAKLAPPVLSDELLQFAARSDERAERIGAVEGGTQDGDYPS
jgi:hypothetical protein